MEELAFFKELGFPALAFGAMWLQNKSLVAEMRAMNDANDKRIIEQADRHAAERDKMNLTLDNLTNTLNKLYDKPCQLSNRVARNSVSK